MLRNEKKSKFAETGNSNNKMFIIAGLIIVALLAGGAFAVAGKSAADNDPSLVNVGATSYQVADFKEISVSEESGDIVFDMNELKNKKAVTFNIPGINYTLNNVAYDTLPMLAYIKPKGNVIVAASICEPCSGFTFHIEGDQLVCNACDTRWSLEDLKGISGGCPDHPPAKIKYSVEGDKLIIKGVDLKNWAPRPV